MLGEHGIAAAVLVIVLVSVGGGLATPVVVDSVDVSPDSPLYGLERVGEGIREAVAGGQSMDVALAQERAMELESMVAKGKAARYHWLADEVAERLEKAGEGVRDDRGLVRAMEAVQTHVQRLENLLDKENLPERARLAVSLAVCRSSMVMGTLAEVQAKVEAREMIRERIREMREEFRELKKEAEENLREGLPVELPIQQANLRVAEMLMPKVERVIIRNPENAEDLAEILQQRLEEALANCVDNQRLENMIEKITEYWERLENIRENLPENIPWLPVICRRIVAVIVVVDTMPVRPMPVVPPAWRENIRERLREIRENIRQLREEIRERLRRGENAEEVSENVEMSTIDLMLDNLEARAENAEGSRLAFIVSEKIHKMASRMAELEGLERLERRLERLEELRERAPPGTPLALLTGWAENCRQTIAEIKEGLQSGELQPQQAREQILQRIHPIRR